MKKFITITLLLMGLAGSIILSGSCGGGQSDNSSDLAGLNVIFSSSDDPVAGTWCGLTEDDPAGMFPPVSSHLQVLPPMGVEAKDGAALDDDLDDYLVVSICMPSEGGTCYFVREFNFEGDGKGHSTITIEDDDYYHVNWKVEKEQVGIEFEVHFLVGGLDLGTARLTPESPRTIPIKFRVTQGPFIRAYVLQARGLSAMEITQELMGLFTLTPLETAWLLNALEFSLEDIYQALTETMGITDGMELEGIFEDLCFPESEFLSLTALPVVSRFTPVLKFDKAWKGLPMSADVYFNAVLSPLANESDGTITWTTPWNGPPLGSYWDSTSGMFWDVVTVCGRDECNNGMNNNDFITLTNGKVPTYFDVVSDKGYLNEGRLRISYWWYYGFQKACNDGGGAVSDDGAHHADWEHIIVTTTPDRNAIETVTYFFHGDWYTRRAGYFETWDGERPVAYVGKTAHGSYHSRDHSGWMIGTPSHCCEYADYRNPSAGSIWSNADGNLVSLSLEGESWMLADHIDSLYEYNGNKYQIQWWRWGPHISHCEFDLFGCWDWDHSYAIGTHPTGDKPSWTMGSCSGEGCSGYTFVCAYSANYNQGWPVNYSMLAKWEVIDPVPVESLFQVSYFEGTCSQTK